MQYPWRQLDHYLPSKHNTKPARLIHALERTSQQDAFGLFWLAELARGLVARSEALAVHAGG